MQIWTIRWTFQLFKIIRIIIIIFQNDRKIRRSRQLHTSARYLDLFQEKAELNDVDKDAFQQVFFFFF